VAHSDYCEGGFVVHQGLVEVDPFSAEFAVGGCRQGGEVGERALDAEAVYEVHGGFKVLEVAVGVAEDLVGRNVFGIGACGEEIFDSFGKLLRIDFRACLLLPVGRCGFEAEIESLETCADHELCDIWSQEPCV